MAQMGEQGAAIDKLDLRSGRKQRWKELAIPDPAGVVDHLTGEPLGRGGYSRIYLISDARATSTATRACLPNCMLPTGCADPG